MPRIHWESLNGFRRVPQPGVYSFAPALDRKGPVGEIFAPFRVSRAEWFVWQKQKMQKTQKDGKSWHVWHTNFHFFTYMFSYICWKTCSPYFPSFIKNIIPSSPGELSATVHEVDSIPRDSSVNKRPRRFLGVSLDEFGLKVQMDQHGHVIAGKCWAGDEILYRILGLQNLPRRAHRNLA